LINKEIVMSEIEKQTIEAASASRRFYKQCAGLGMAFLVAAISACGGGGSDDAALSSAGAAEQTTAQEDDEQAEKAVAMSPQAIEAEIQADIQTYLKKIPGAKQTGPNEVTLPGGDKITIDYVPPGAQDDPAADAALGGSSYFRFYNKANFEGRRATYHPVPPPTGTTCTNRTIPLPPRVDGSVTSWVNKTSTTVTVYDGAGNYLWTMRPSTKDTKVARRVNNRAESFKCYH
jgi:hypothetical protein